MIAKFIIYCSELLMTTCVKAWLRAFHRITLRRHLPTPLHFHRRYVYVSNHASYLDPLVMWSILHFRQRINGAPTKVMTAPRVYYSPLRPLIWCLGAFPAKKKPGALTPSGVEGALHYLRNGYNICIFPEGRRSLPFEHQPFTGVSKILEGSSDAEMILLHIIWQPGPWWKRHLEIRAQSAPENLNKQDPEAIMAAIYSL